MTSGGQEVEGIVFEDDNNSQEGSNLQLCLLGRFLTDRTIRFNTMKETLATAWKPGKRTTIREIEPGLFLFQFYHKVDKERVLSGGPWHFENHMLVLHEVKEGDLFNQIPLNHIDIWVQIHHLPAGFMTQRRGEQIGNGIGKFIQYDASNNGFWRTYMRIRVKLDVRIPIKKELKVKIQGGEWHVVQLRYEKLGNFCFLCGVLGHTQRFCDKLYSMEIDDGTRNWGPELRAEFKKLRAGSGSRWLKEGGDTPAVSNNDGTKTEERNCSNINANNSHTETADDSSIQHYSMRPSNGPIINANNSDFRDGGIIANVPVIPLMRGANHAATISVSNLSLMEHNSNLHIQQVHHIQSPPMDLALSNINEKAHVHVPMLIGDGGILNESQHDKKRRREHGSTSGSKGEKYAPFLRAGPGTQAFREK
ncbi:hypothetical protein TSUD_180770 [Trifolium subterraneum]|uniref:CCHC-type domain-containing protein n=1 Tax=Trifolium subterraneum TaxID=3900 RepID=A0A2Z6NPW4_TRISU|nr:hypothetical protein TSUD_180770 [Trifolium subterraneum]